MPVSTTIRQFDNTDWQLIEINMLNSLDDYIKKNSITTLSRVTGIKTVTLLGIQKKLIRLQQLPMNQFFVLSSMLGYYTALTVADNLSSVG